MKEEMRSCIALYQTYFETNLKTEAFKNFAYGYLMGLGNYPNAEITDAIEEVME